MNESYLSAMKSSKIFITLKKYILNYHIEIHLY